MAITQWFWMVNIYIKKRIVDQELQGLANIPKAPKFLGCPKCVMEKCFQPLEQANNKGRLPQLHSIALTLEKASPIQQ